MFPAFSDQKPPFYVLEKPLHTALGRPRIAKKRLFSANGKSFCPSCGEQTLTIRFAKTFSDRYPCTFHPSSAENRY
jgi:hypothetical protein